MKKRTTDSKSIGKKKAVLIIIFFSIVIVSVLMTFGISLFLQNRRNSQFYYALDQVDDLIIKGDFFDAKELFFKISEPPVGLLNGMLYLKRAFIISEKMGNYKLLRSTSEKVFNLNKPYQELAAIYVYSLLRTDKGKKAWKIAKENLFQSKYSSLIAEAYLKATSQLLNPEQEAILTDEDLALLQINNFNSILINKLIPIYEDAFAYSKDIRLVKNLALLYCAKGDFKKAWQVSLPKVKDEYPQLYLKISFDAGEDEEVLSVIDKLQEKTFGPDADELLLIKADIFNRRKNYKESLLIYKKLINNNQRTSLVPYQNLLSISTFLTDSQKRQLNFTDSELISIYRPLLENKKPFSDSFTSMVELILLYTELLARSEKVDQAAAFLRNYIFSDYATTEMHLMLHQLVDSSRSDLFISQMQFLMRKDPVNEMIPQVLCYYLKAFPDRKIQLDNTLKISKDQFSEREWIFFYETWSLLLIPTISNLKLAAGNFDELFKKYDKWEYSFNGAEIYYFLSDLEKADRMAQIAETKLLGKNKKSNKELKKIFGKVKVLQGRIYQKDEKWDDSINAYQSALSYDMTNIDAILALQQLRKK